MNLKKLPVREATELERRKMLGSLATVYEMRNPLVHHVGTKFFYILDFYKDETIVLPKGSELVILKTEKTLPSIFRKPGKKKPSKIWK